MLKKNTKNIPQKVVSMEDLHNKKAVEHNDLITSVAKMDKVPLKIFELAVSFLDTTNSPENNVVHISKSTLFNFFNVEDNDKHSRFKRALTNLHQQSIFEVQEENDKGKWKFKIISPISSSEWNDYDDNVKIKFTDDIMPYLLELKSNFTQYLITDIIKLNSKYSIILYKWLSMNYNQYEAYKENGQRRENQLELLKNPYIDIHELRRITNTLDEYERFDNFENWTLKKPIEEINNFTHFTVTYEKIKKGNRSFLFKYSSAQHQAKAALAFSTNWAKAAFSNTAKSANTLRSISMAAFFRPFMNLL